MTDQFTPADIAPAVAPVNKWSPEQEALLRKHYATMPIPELMELLGKTKTAIYGKAHTLGLIRIGKTVRHEGQNFTIGKPRVVPKHAVPTVVREAPVRNGNAKGTYVGAELQPFAGRPGALDAYALPSLAGSRRTYRDGRVTAPAGAGVAHALSDGQIEAMPVWRNFVGLWPESRREIVDAVVDLLTTPPAQATDSVLEDAARLEFEMQHGSAIDAARKQGGAT